MKILHVVGGLPTENKPSFQPFVKSQIDSLMREGIGIEIYDIRGYESSFNYLKAISNIRKIVKEKGIDLIHAHYSYCGLVSYFAHTNKPIILSLMGSDIMGRRDKTGKIRLRGKLDKLLAKFIINKMDHIIVKSNKMKNLIKTKQPISVIPNGVDIDLFKPEDSCEARKKLGLNQDDFFILFLGNKDNIVKNFKLAEESVSFFKKIMRNEKITFLNPYGIKHSEVINYLNAADVLLLTSFFEGSPNIIKEAMACNLPIISVDVGDVKERIQNTFNCFIADLSIDEICQKLEIIYKNKRRSNGRENISELSSERIAERIINTYKEVIKN